MNSVSFECEVITPMFMSGVNNQKPELRPSEFKGMMRFWWRAIRAENEIDKLRKEEAKIFGGTKKGEGKSKLLIRIIPLKITASSYSLLPCRDQGGFQLEAIKPGSKFRISLITYYTGYLKTFKNLFLLSLILGGFGRRARRGFGSVKTSEQKDIDLEYIANLLNSISPNIFQVQNGRIVNTKEGGAYPWIKEIQIGTMSSDKWKETLQHICEASHKFRDPSLGFIKPRMAFPKCECDVRRMASPIFVSVIKKNSSFCPIITTLNSKFPCKCITYDLKKQEEFKEYILKGHRS